MAMTLACPSCSRALRVPEELIGKAVRCPTCRTEFTGSSAPAAPPPAPDPSAAVAAVPNLSLEDPVPPAPGPAGSTPDSVPPPPPSTERKPEVATRPCPACGERIGVDDERCRYCGEEVAEEEERPWERSHRLPVRRDCEPHRGQMILVFGIVSLALLACGAMTAVFGLPFGIAAWLLGSKDLEKMRQGTMDPEGQGLTQAGRICGIVGTILDGLFLLGCGAYIVVLIAAGAFK
jgi:predicted Zn finger-like uncharacterized protein